ncbi:unnamed protein product, partial [Sphacelaria rigidula]
PWSLKPRVKLGSHCSISTLQKARKLPKKSAKRRGYLPILVCSPRTSAPVPLPGFEPLNSSHACAFYLAESTVFFLLMMTHLKGLQRIYIYISSVILLYANRHGRVVNIRFRYS